MLREVAASDVSSTAEECLRSAAPFELVPVKKLMTIMSLHQGHNKTDVHFRVVSHLHSSPLPWTTPINLERCLKAHSVEQALNSSVCQVTFTISVKIVRTSGGQLCEHRNHRPAPLTFVRCVALNCMWLPLQPTQIGKEVFLNCVALQEVVIPTELCDMGIRAFCGCEKLQRFTPWDWRDIEQSAQALEDQVVDYLV